MFVGTSVTPLPETRLVTVRVRLGSAQLAHDVALALAEEYIAYDIDHRTTAAREAVDWIAGQIGQQRAEVATAEAAVVAYRTAHPDVPLSDDTMVAEQGLVELQEDVNEATTVRIARRAAYRQVTDAAGDPARLVRLPALTAEPVLQNAVGEVERLRAAEQRLAEAFGDLHPELVRARADVRTAEARLGERIADLVAGLQRRRRERRSRAPLRRSGVRTSGSRGHNGRRSARARPRRGLPVPLRLRFGVLSTPDAAAPGGSAGGVGERGRRTGGDSLCGRGRGSRGSYGCSRTRPKSAGQTRSAGSKRPVSEGSRMWTSRAGEPSGPASMADGSSDGALQLKKPGTRSRCSPERTSGAAP